MMQIRCFKCQMPISLSQATIYAALDEIHDNDLTHYDVRCPRCRKVNRVSADQLRRAAPNWKRERDAEAAA
jgi:phage FluMu protein Com